MNKNEASTLFERFGLRARDADLYLAALEGGRNTALSLSRRTGIKRGTVYEIVERLKERGFLRTTKLDARRYIEAVSPKDVGERFKESAQLFDRMVPDLIALQPAHMPRPRITFFEGEDEVWQIYEDTLKEKKPISSYTSVTDLYHLLTPHRIENYIRKRAEKKIPIRILAVDSPESRRWARRGPMELRETRLVRGRTHDFAADVEIYGNKVAIVSFKSNLFGVLIESEQIAQMQLLAFELMWNAAPHAA